MNLKAIIIAFLLTLLIVCLTIGKMFLSVGVYVFIVIILFVCLLYYIYLLLNIEKNSIEEKICKINLDVNTAKIEILENQTMLKELIMDDIAEKYSLQQSLYRKSIDATNDELKSLAGSLGTVYEQLLKRFESNTDRIEKNLILTLEQGKNNHEEAKKTVENISNNLSSAIRQQRHEIEIMINTSMNSTNQIIQDHIDCLCSMISELSYQENLSKESLFNSLDEIKDKTEGLSDKIETAKIKVDGIFMDLESIKLQNIDLQKSLSTNISDRAKFIVESINKKSDNISEKFNVLAKQNQIYTSEVRTFNDLNRENNETISLIKHQCDYLLKGITNVQEQSNNIERLVSEYSKLSSNVNVIDSIKLLIEKLYKELKSSVSEINDEILETQIKQETTNGQIEKLQILLRNLSNGSEGKGNRNTFQSKSSQTLSKPITNTTKSWSTSSSTHKDNQTENCSAQTKLSSTSNYIQKKTVPDSNRIEKIIDKETNNIVLNQYINDILVKSIMKNKKGSILYELEYKNGQIDRSKNYDEKGNLNIEQTYYDNGQVHFRYEIIKGKKKSTEFDRNGNKK